MVKLFVTLYNWFHKWRMRNVRRSVEGLQGVDLSTLNKLDKLLPLLKEQLNLISDRDLRLVSRGDIYSISLPMFFLQYSFFSQWLRKSVATISLHGNVDGEGYINLTNEVHGYSTNAISVRITTWLPWNIMDGNGVDLSLFYGMVKEDITYVEKAMSTVTDPFFKNYYDQRFASALQDLLLVIYTINEMVAFYEWRR